MFTTRQLLTLTLTIMIAAITCALVLAAGAQWPGALLSGGGAGGATLAALPKLLSRRDP
ncbi:unnamed protein product [[Actinomadura] parvosata subsp. kistnae]|uniref:Uncharacterized protein n=1 Tax=Nonomuraea composti TaxID=2720023 RepID=A0ABX1BER2_9ACTN|nr:MULTISPECIES: hypothetical protein [unclassified Nonomuraea]NJP94249.1 hypothetical protein [Nonomuraea sp. FMUSA5-5]SPL91710.1 unnamed protein product [Actinomadura parvosata subsp. kistnae]